MKTKMGLTGTGAGVLNVFSANPEMVASGVRSAAICLALMLAMGATTVRAADEAKPAEVSKEATAEAKAEAAPAEAAATEEKAAEEKADEKTEATTLTPEQYFEGGEKTYPNWVELGMGGMFISGSRAQAEQSRRLSRGVFGGIEDFHYQDQVATNLNMTIDGRAMFDQNDYKLTLGLNKPEKWFLRFHYEEFRTWYNANGGYFPFTGSWYDDPFRDDATALDRGEISLEGGVILKKWPSLTFKYTHDYRDGQKGSTAWGQTHPGLASARGLFPSFYDIDEQRDTFELNATKRVKATDFGLGVRYEHGDLDDTRKMWQWPGEGRIPPAAESKITDRQGTTYDLFNLHAFSETWLKKNLFFSAGFLFTDLDNEFSGSRIYGEDFGVGYTPHLVHGNGYYDLDGGSHKNEYVLNLNLMSTQVKHFTIVPSIRVQRSDWDADSSGFFTSGTSAPTFRDADSDGDALDVRERLDVRYTGFTNWVLYGQGEWTEGRGNLDESSAQLGLPAPIIRRDTEDERLFQKYSAGTRWYPARNLSVDVGGYYKLNRYDYDHDTDNTINSSGNRYPAYLLMQDFETYDANARLTYRPWKKVSLVTRYEYQVSTIHTKPDSLSGLGEVESSEMTSHIIAQNVSWSPWSRLYLQAGFNYVLSQTETPTSDYTEAVIDAENNYWTLNLNSGFVLDDKTDLNLGYTYYRADNYDDISPDGVPFGAGNEEHGITATLVRRLTERLRLTLRYGYFHAEDDLSGGNNDYESHVLFSSLQYRF